MFDIPRSSSRRWRFSRLENFIDGWARPEWSSRSLVVFLSFGVVLYSLYVLWVVATSGDIGVRCVFGTLVKAEVDPAYRWLEAKTDGSRLVPAIGDRLLRIRHAEGLWDVPIAKGDYSAFIQAQKRIAREPDGTRVLVQWKPDAAELELRESVVLVRRRPFQNYVWSLIWFAQELVIFGIGAWVYWKRPRDISARVFYWLCVVTVGAFMGGYHWSDIVISRPLIFLFVPMAMLVPVVSLHFYLVFPRPNPFLLLRPRLVLGLVYGVPAVYLVAIWIVMGWMTLVRQNVIVGPSHVNAFAASSVVEPILPDMESGQKVASRLEAQAILKGLALGYVGYSVLVFGLCIACLVYSFRRARNRAERSQVQWILLASVLASFLIAYLLWLAVLDTATLGLDSAAWPMYVVSLLYTSAYAVSISRYRLMQAEEIFNRSVRYVLVSVTVGVLYSGVLVVGAFLIGQSLRSDQTSREGLVVAVTALVMLVLSGAARERFQKAIDRRFFRVKYKFDQAMRQMSHAVEQLVDQSTLGTRLLEVASDLIGLDWGAFYLRDGRTGSMTLVACLGPRPDQARLLPDNPLVQRLMGRRTIRIMSAQSTAHSDAATDAMIALGGEMAAALDFDGELAGLVVLGPKRNGLPYDDEETAFLGALASIGALALRSAATHQTLEELNQELRDKVEKITEQQRRIMILQDRLLERDEPESGPMKTESREGMAEAGAFDLIRGSSATIRRAVNLVRKAASSSSSVLILGESGTGKELLAEAIHRASQRANGPFVKVHCAALSQNLLESELFGHVKGAFTGADRDRVGRFQQADGGTLFLDEIGDINLEVQTKLLRVLQSRTFEKVGSSTSITVDVRIVAATNQDLPSLIREGLFREDLYYRLNVIGIQSPPLRERKEDIFELSLYFLGKISERLGKTVSHLTDEALEALTTYNWPGNVRELENVLERTVVLSEGPAITLADLPDELQRAGTEGSRGLGRRTNRPGIKPVPSRAVRAESRRPSVRADLDTLDDGRFDEELENFERRRLTEALGQALGNKSEAARLLGMPRSTLVSKLKKYGLMSDRDAPRDWRPKG